MLAAPRVRPAGLSLLAVLAVSASCGPPSLSPRNLLTDLPPANVVDVQNVDRLTDGIAADEGDIWESDLTTRIRTARSSVVFDLGADKPIRCALLQGDDNDDYHLAGSTDGNTWTPLCEAGPQRKDGPGMRTRYGRMELTARYLRLTASGGDGLFSVAEFAVFDTC